MSTIFADIFDLGAGVDLFDLSPSGNLFDEAEVSSLILDMPMQDDAASTVVDAVVGSDGILIGGDDTNDLSIDDGPGGDFPKALHLGDPDYFTASAAVSGGDFQVLYRARTTASGADASGAVVFDGPSTTGLGFSPNGLPGYTDSVEWAEISVADFDPTIWHVYQWLFDLSEGVLTLYLDGTLAGTIDDPVPVFEELTEFGQWADPVNLVANEGDMCGLRVYSDAETPASYAPLVLVAPTFSATAGFLGEELTGNTGTWASFPNATLTYQWQRANDSAGTGAASIGSATSANYTPVSADLTKYVRRVTTYANGVSPDAVSNGSWIRCFTGVSLPAADELPADLADVTAFHGQFLYNEAFSDSDQNEATPDPLTYETDSPVGTIDWSWLAIAYTSGRASFGGASLISPSFVLMGVHGGSSQGATLTFMEQDEDEITRTLSAVYDLGVTGSLRIGKLNSPVTTIDPIPLLADSGILSGEYILGIELNRHLNRMQVESPFGNGSQAVTMLTPGVDKIEGGDSGKPGVAIFGTQPVLAMAAFISAVSGSASGVNPSCALSKIAAILATEGEELTLLGTGGGSPSGALGGAVSGGLRSALMGAFGPSSEDEE